MMTSPNHSLRTRPELIAVIVLTLVVGGVGSWFLQRLPDNRAGWIVGGMIGIGLFVLIQKLAVILGEPKQDETAWDLSLMERQMSEIREWIESGKTRKLIHDSLKPCTNQDVTAWREWFKAAPFFMADGETLRCGERQSLTNWAIFLAIYLVAVAVLSAWWVESSSRSVNNRLALCIGAGVFGSCIAAFRSFMDRRANGFEDRFGNQSPRLSVAKERFGHGMIPWLSARPLLGAGVGYILYRALYAHAFPEAVTTKALDPKDVSSLVFYAIIAGLFAKTLLDLVLEVVKKVFDV